MEDDKELVARYIQAVRFWLPKQQQDDISAELAEDLQSSMDERASALGRPLDKAETAAMLKHNGRPMLVATRYLPQQSLIGPVLFPVYLFMLRMIALFYLGPWLLLLIGLSAFHFHGTSLGEGLRTFWTVAFTSIGVMTVVFALLERYQAQSRIFENWDPRKLPAVRQAGHIKRSGSITEIIVNAVLAMWWANGWASEFILSVSRVHITVLPAWTQMVWLLVLLAAANIALAVFNLARPYWTRPRAWLRLALDAAGAAVFCWFLEQQVLAQIVAPGLTSAKAAQVVHAINAALAHAFPVCVAVSVLVVLIADLPRIVRNQPGGRHPAGTASLVL